MRQLNLDILKQGLPGFSKTIGAYLAEAALVCLEENKHQSGVLIEITGDFQETFEIIWTGKYNKCCKRGMERFKGGNRIWSYCHSHSLITRTNRFSIL